MLKQAPKTPEVLFAPGWLESPDELLAWLQSHCHWQHETITLFGKPVQVPRKVAWFGEPGLSYQYSGVDHMADGWPAALLHLKASVDELLPKPTNFVLANFYENGGQYMGWHRDDEPTLSGPVVSVSLGATRRFLLETEPGDERTEYPLGHGALLVHPRHWRHSLPKTRKPVGLRINLSFRRVV